LEYFHEGFDENHGIKREAIVREDKWYVVDLFGL
jgi:hypothetical protein